MKIEIKHNLTGEVLFEYEKENNTIKDTLMEAIKKGADLRGADLSNSNLDGIDLHRTDLSGANLYNVNLTDANLFSTNFYGANLYGANLFSAYLYNTDLRDADLRDALLRHAKLKNANLCGSQFYINSLYKIDLHNVNLCDVKLFNSSDNVGIIEDWMSFDNVGSRKSKTLFFKTNKGVFVQCGCFFGNLEEFVAEVKKTHNGNKHEMVYLTIIESVKINFEL